MSLFPSLSTSHTHTHTHTHTISLVLFACPYISLSLSLSHLHTPKHAQTNKHPISLFAFVETGDSIIVIHFLYTFLCVSPQRASDLSMASNSGTEFQLFFFLFVPALSLWISIPTECTNCICLSLGAFHRSQWNKKSHFLPENWIKVKVTNQLQKTIRLMLCNKSEFVNNFFTAVHVRAANTFSYIVGRCVIF